MKEKEVWARIFGLKGMRVRLVKDNPPLKKGLKGTVLEVLPKAVLVKFDDLKVGAWWVWRKDIEVI